MARYIRLVKDDPDLANKAARDYIERGWAPLAWPVGMKGESKKGWDKVQINLENVDKYFPKGEKRNIGVLMGMRSNDLADIDLDAREAVAMAPYFLPDTNAIFGRMGKQRSHWLYYIHDAVGINKASEKLVDDEDGCIIELRLGAGNRAAQTIFPGSVHTSGEQIEWSDNGDPADLSFGDALNVVKRIAAAALLLRGWPTGKGNRHTCAFIVGAFLARAGLTVEEIKLMVRAIATEAGDDEVGDRVNAAVSSAENTLKGEQTYGLPKMIEQFGEKRTEKIAKYLDYRSIDEDETLERMNEQFCILPIGTNAKMHVLTWRKRGERREAMFFRPDEFKTAFNNVRVGKAGRGTWWLGHAQRKQYDGLVFRPGEPSIIENELNLWNGWGIQPKPGSWALMQHHINVVLAGEDAAMADYIVKWAAWAFQNPGARAEVALVTRGVEGCGKGVFFRSIKEAFGQHGLHISDHEHLIGKFNKHLMDCAFLFCDEAWWPGAKKAEGTIKRMLTEPTLLIEPKSVDIFEVHNSLHVGMAANAEWVVAASPNARRFAVSNATDTYVGNTDYFRALYGEVHSGGIAAMMYDMLAMDLEGWHPRKNIPQTTALREQQMLSLDAWHQMWFELLEDGMITQKNIVRNQADKELKYVPDRTVPSQEIFELVRGSSPQLKNSSDHKIAAFLQTVGCARVRITKFTRGFQLPPLKEARSAWEVKYGPHQWNEAEEWEQGESQI